MNRRQWLTVAASGIIVPKLIGSIYRQGRGVRASEYHLDTTLSSGDGAWVVGDRIAHVRFQGHVPSFGRIVAIQNCIQPYSITIDWSPS